MPDGKQQEPGRWNRFALEVSDLTGTGDNLRKAGIRFRNELVTGVGGKQILVEDPSGNPVELFEPLVSQTRLDPPDSQSGTKILDTSHRIEWRFVAGVDRMRQTLPQSGVCQTDVRQHRQLG